MNKHMREPANGFVSSHANGKWGSQAIYVILNVGLTSVFQNLVKKFPLALWEREQLCEQSELTTAGEGLIRCEDAKRRRCEASIVTLFPLLGEGLRERVLLEDRKLGKYEDRLLTENSSFLPLLGKDKRMGNNQYPPQPSLIREGATHVDMLDNSCQHLSCNSEGSTLPRNDKFSSRFTLHTSPRRKAAFTLAEMMVVMLILSIIMAAMAPVMTTRNKLDQSSPWVWATNGSDAYYGLGDAQIAMIGQQEAEDTDTNARLVINAGDGKDHILFKTDNSSLGQLRFSNNGLLLGSLSSGNLVENSVAIGRNTQVAQDNSTAVGVNASASNSNATAIGFGTTASGIYSIAIGGEAPPTHAAQSNGDGSIAIGPGTVASQASSISIGSITESTGLHSIAIGTNNNVSGQDSIVLGVSNGEVSGTGSIVLGRSNGGVSTNNSILIGNNINLSNLASEAVVIGEQPVGQTRTISIGRLARANSSYAIAIGSNSDSDTVTSAGQNGIAIGRSAVTSADNSIAIGTESISGEGLAGGNSVALGFQAKTIGPNSVALGPYAEAGNSTGDTTATALGYATDAFGSSSVALGALAKANNDYNVAIGYNACSGVTGKYKVCIGANSGPSSGSSWASASDSTERIFIGSRSNFNNGPAVLEVHNGTTSNSDGTALHGQKISSSVVINGLLIVKGGIISAAAENDDKHIRTGGVYWFANRDQDSQAAVIGVGSGLDNFQNNGNFKSPNDWSYNFSVSDRRLKYVGKENTSGLDKIKQLKVFNYTFKKDEKKTPHVGVIAQDLQKVFPDAVTKAKDGFLRIRFEDMFYAMINAIKELDSRITALEKENQQMSEILKQVQNDNRKLNATLNRIHDDNKKLEARIEKLEAQIK